MEMGPFDAKAEPDRFATCDEIRAALSFLPDISMELGDEGLWEVASDLGGHVLVESEDDKVVALLEKLDGNAN